MYFQERARTTERSTQEDIEWGHCYANRPGELENSIESAHGAAALTTVPRSGGRPGISTWMILGAGGADAGGGLGGGARRSSASTAARVRAPPLSNGGGGGAVTPPCCCADDPANGAAAASVAAREPDAPNSPASANEREGCGGGDAVFNATETERGVRLATPPLIAAELSSDLRPA